MKRLAIITSHPIQYNAPWFKLLNQTGKVNIKVFYTWGQTGHGAKYDPGFGKVIEWDIPLLEGYDYEFVENVSPDPGSHHYKGIINPGLIERIQSWNPDALLVFGWSFKSHLKCLRFFHKKIPVLFRGDSTLLNEEKGIKKIARRIFLRWVYRHVDYALYAGINNKKYFQAHGLSENRLVFAPHAIDNERFSNGDVEYEQQANQWRRELGIDDEDIVVLYAGKLETVKNPALILKIAAAITHPRLKFVIVGNGHLAAELRQTATADKRIHFLEFQNQNRMPLVYRLGDIFILPSKSETWGLAINEAMACSRPVIASDKVGCAVDLIHPHKNGLIFPNGSHKECVSFLTTLLDNRTKLKEMGLASKMIVSEYSYMHIVNCILDILEG